MVKHEIMIIANYTEESWLTLDELCESCNLSSDIINQLIAYEIIHPQQLQGQQIFSINDLQRVKTALRLQRDLEVNIAGVALALDLLNELEELRAQMKFYKAHF